MSDSKYGKYIVTELKTPDFSPEYVAEYAKWATRILYLDRNVVDGAFQMNCSWYHKAGNTQMTKGHVHDTDEVIGFFGSDPENPHDLGGEVEIWLDDEKHLITKSCLIFIPRGMKHCPLLLRRVDRPIFHFSTLTGGMYTKEED
ncbi:MAG: hypothetical protein JW882_17480 [Deltaproteobacteria bacterium]|nr:hypothetical protein [Deltaproteobacteria bacterium]